MGAIRATLNVATLGGVRKHSKKQRIALKTLAAVQGASPEQVRHTADRGELAWKARQAASSRTASRELIAATAACAAYPDTDRSIAAGAARARLTRARAAAGL